MHRNIAAAKPARLRDPKESPSPLTTKKIKVPLTEREAARLDPRQLEFQFDKKGER
jgi:hypothetical protein